MGTFKYAEAGLGVGVGGGGDLLSGLFVVTRREQSVSHFMSFKREGRRNSTSRLCDGRGIREDGGLVQNRIKDIEQILDDFSCVFDLVLL